MNLHDFWCTFKFSNKKNNSFAIKSLGLSLLCSEKIDQSCSCGLSSFRTTGKFRNTKLSQSFI